MQQATKPAMTPPEILRAAYQAEASGQIAYAAQAYRYLVDVYARSPEASEAIVALRRLQQAPDAAMTASSGKPLSEALASQTGRPAYTAPPVAFQHPPSARPDTAGRDLARQPKTIQRRPSAGPQPIRGYKVGRALSVLMIATGWLMLAIAAGMAGMNLSVAVGLVKVANVPSALRETLPVLAGLLPAGVALLLLGQVFLAIFRTANATATLVAQLQEHADADDEHG